MKIKLVSAAALVAMSGSAFALDPATSLAAGTAKVYASGATALRNVVGGLFTQNCAAGTLDVYYSAAGSAAGAGDAAAGDSFRVYSCTLRSEATLDPEFQGKGLGGVNVTFYKIDRGGSAQGVQPVASPAGVGTPLPYMDLTSCGARVATVPNYTCTGLAASQVPLLGVSDVEPQLFVGVNVPTGFNAGGLSAAELGALTVTPVVQTVFGVAVNTRLRDALQAAQGLVVGDNTDANRPSVPRSVVGSIFRGEAADPANGLGWHALGVASPDKQVNVARRVAGSGTQAAANMYFGGFPCGPNAKIPATNTDFPSSTGGNSNAGPFTGTGLYVYEGSSTGNVISFLTNAQADAVNAPYAIGHVSLENAETASFKHVRVDGVLPTRANATAGRYDYVVESTFQYITNKVNTLKASASATDKVVGNFVEAFVTSSGLPKNLAALSVANQNGVASLPDAGPFNAAAVQTNVLNGGDLTRFNSRMSRGGNSCNPWGVVQ
jgi:ABC-type phosphate transport system substrate-binding protein